MNGNRIFLLLACMSCMNSNAAWRIERAPISHWDGNARLNYALPILNEDVKSLIKEFLISPDLGRVLKDEKFKATVADNGDKKNFNTNLVAISPDRTRVATAKKGSCGPVKIWDARSHVLLGTLELFARNNQQPPIYAIAISSEGRVVVASTNTVAGCWDAGTGHLISKTAGGAPIEAIACAPDSNTFVLGRWMSQKAEVCSMQTGQCIREIAPENVSPQGFGAFAMSADGVLVSGDGLKTRALDYESSKELWCGRVDAPQGDPHSHESFTIRAAALSVDGNFIVTGSDIHAHVFDARTGGLVRKLHPKDERFGSVYAIALSSCLDRVDVPGHEPVLLPFHHYAITSQVARASLTGLVLMNQIARLKVNGDSALRLHSQTQRIFDALPQDAQVLLQENNSVRRVPLLHSALSNCLVS